MNENEYKAVRDFLDDCSDEALMEIARDINSYNGDCDSLTWYDMDEFDEFCSGMSPLDIARTIFYGDFNPNDDYFQYDGYANFVSCSYPEFDDCDKDEMVDSMKNIPFQYLSDDIKDVLNELEEEEEEEE